MFAIMNGLTAIASLGVLATLAVGAATANRPQPVSLAPSSNWHVDYADDSCRLARQFGDGDRRILLIMDRFEPGDAFRLSLYGPILRRANTGYDARLRFGPDEAEQRSAFRDGTAGDVPAIFFNRWIRIASPSGEESSPIDSAREAATNSLHVHVRGFPPFVLETGSMGPPLSALRQCTDELLDHWEIDVEKHRSLSRRATPTRPPASWFSSNDYPGGAVVRGEGAIVHFRLIVDARGEVRDCRIQRSTQGEAFKTAVCDAIRRRARFQPALDAEGNPIQSYYVNIVNFIMAS